jgi:hypothetical protein
LIQEDAPALVCMSNREMPHAEVPFKSLWLDQNALSVLVAAYGLASCPAQ